MSADRRGRLAEAVAVWHLRLRGWRVLARRFVVGRGSGAGEIDIVVRRGPVVAMVEVKIRRDHDTAAAAVGARQRRRILRSAEEFLRRHPELAGCCVRFDAMLLAPWRLPRHVQDAWRDEV